jgi:two-component system chemotaxis response regulator CheB
VDYLFSSAARMYGAGTLALVMTGMGADGLTGARLVHNAGGVVMTQDKATSAVWGMPGRVFQAGISRDPLPLGALADELIARVGAGRDAQSGAGDAAVKLAVPRREVARERRLEVLHGML